MKFAIFYSILLLPFSVFCVFYDIALFQSTYPLAIILYTLLASALLPLTLWGFIIYLFADALKHKKRELSK